MRTVEDIRKDMAAIAKPELDEPLDSEAIANYEKFSRELEAVSKTQHIQQLEAAWSTPRVNIVPQSVIKGSRDDGRYTFDKYLRGDQGAARELLSFSATGEGYGNVKAQEQGARMLRWPLTKSAEEMQSFAQTETTTAGGYLVPTVTQDVMVKITKAFGGLSARASHINTAAGAPINFPSIDDTANVGALAAINTAPGSGGADLVFTQITLGAWKYAATGTGQGGLKVPRELIDDALFDVTGLVTEMLGVRLARQMAADYTQGIGTTAPTGLFHFTSSSTAAWVLSTGLVQATANQQLQAFIHNLDPSYVTENTC